MVYIVSHIPVLKPPLVEELVRKRDEEMGNRKEERKKAAESAAMDEKKKEGQGGAASSTKLTNVSSSGDVSAVGIHLQRELFPLVCREVIFPSIFFPHFLPGILFQLRIFFCRFLPEIIM